MASQGSDDPTQELSQSHYTTLLQNRSRSEVQLPAEQDEEEEECESQLSLQEGMEGHIDLLSSLTTPKNATTEPDSDPVDFLPTQSQHALSQFPESQRFKTPATVGKKRRYDGAIIESPELPRNPLLRHGTDNHSHVIGLSQAFAATQANTSPFIPDANGILPSDRPSPSIELQPRPMTAASSSPMRPIYAFKRASTEPASRYVSVREEQAERERQALARRQEILDTDDFSDGGLGLEPSPVARDRRQREIEQRLQAKLQRLSSPSRPSLRGASLSKSSPIRPPTRASPRENRSMRSTRFLDRSSPSRRNVPTAADDSEEETEQEDNVEVAVARSSQALMAVDEEDKENFIGNGSQVPETTARLIRITNGVPLEVLEDSPSLRRGMPVDADTHMPLLGSSQPFAVADSQASQSRRIPKTARLLDSSSAEEAIDFVPQSPSTPLRPSESNAQVDTADNANKLAAPEGHTPPSLDPPSGSSGVRGRQLRRSTIPETSSNEQQPSSKAVTGQDDEAQKAGDESSRGQFETAQSRLPSSTEMAVDQPGAGHLSVPSTKVTPTSRKRKRMSDIAAEPSPLKSQVSFNAAEVLQLEADFQSPGRRTPVLRTPESNRQKRTGERAPSSARTGLDDGLDDAVVDGDRQRRETFNTEDPASSASKRKHAKRTLGLAGPPKHPRGDRKSASRSVGTTKTDQQAAASTHRVSQWDLDASPPTNPVLLTRSGRALKQTAKALDTSSGAHAGPSTKRQKRADKKAAQNGVTNTNSNDRAEEPTSHASPKGDAIAITTELAEPDVDASLVAPNMVFACFNGKTRAYYPALCLGPSTDSNRYLIQWEGYDAEEIDEYGVKSLDLRIGDQVKVNIEGFPKVSYVIKGFTDKLDQHGAVYKPQTTTDIRGYKTLLVTPKQRKSLPPEVSTDLVQEVPVSSIYLDSNMWGQMKDRPYEYKPSLRKVSRSGISTPAERSSSPNTPPSRNRRGPAVAVPLSIPTNVSDGIFTNMAFTISYKNSARRTRLAKLIQGQGGLVLQDSFPDLLESDSTDLKPQFSDLAFTALLTDKHSRKIKYMQALALGVPCLSGKWIEACCRAGELHDWATYLLPAGETAELDGATRSRILPFSHRSEAINVKDVLALRPSIFDGSRVVVVTGHKASEKAARKPYLFLIRALGAGKIETEPDLNAARVTVDQSRSAQGVDAIGWVFVDDRDIGAAKAVFSQSALIEKGRRKSKAAANTEHQPTPQGTNVKVMCNEDIVQTLILGKLWMG